jgi:hypothetical protein
VARAYISQYVSVDSVRAAVPASVADTIAHRYDYIVRCHGPRPPDFPEDVLSAAAVLVEEAEYPDFDGFHHEAESFLFGVEYFGDSWEGFHGNIGHAELEEPEDKWALGFALDVAVVHVPDGPEIDLYAAPDIVVVPSPADTDDICVICMENF